MQSIHQEILKALEELGKLKKENGELSQGEIEILLLSSLLDEER